MPLAEGNLLRLLWLQAFSRAEARTTLQLERLKDRAQTVGCYVFRFDGTRWMREHGTAVQETHTSARADATQAIHVAKASATLYTSGFGAHT